MSKVWAWLDVLTVALTAIIVTAVLGGLCGLFFGAMWWCFKKVAGVG